MNFRDYIEKMNITISDLSKFCKIPYATLHNAIEKPESMRAGNLKKLSIYLKLSMDELYNILIEKTNNLGIVLLEQKRSKLKGNLYHFTQIKFAFNTNRIEGSKLSEDETRCIFETNTLISENSSSNIDDVIETSNHFYLFDVMLEQIENPITESLIKKYHEILKNGTKDARKEWFNVGEYKGLQSWR